MIPALTLLSLCATCAPPAAGMPVVVAPAVRPKVPPPSTQGPPAQPTPTQMAESLGREPRGAKARAKVTVDNNTGPREKFPAGAQPEGQNFYGNAKLPQAGPPHSAYSLLHQKKSSLAAPQGGNLQGHKRSKNNDPMESNRPGTRHREAGSNFTKASWVTNRHPSSVLSQLPACRKGFGSRETCTGECPRDMGEREAYCNSDFAVNGIVQDMESVGKGSRLVTLLVGRDGLYKINRLYIRPDGVFFRVKILLANTSSCPKPCPELKPGVRYILMGQIYQKRMTLPAAMQHIVGGRFGAGDGIIRSSSYVQRYNRRRGRNVLAASHSKCT
ncbi:UPF0450 protein C17orf58 homolog [Xenopus tropicalis]|uniref:UPF0450 protein C17orf58 homolog n=1 Tax=Xenopus tropicalis TaxID=8364 RepID=A0A803JFB2_XENTR|nr:UPF0450 protein C17orf58 homolog [Xenopus tropicalis]